MVQLGAWSKRVATTLLLGTYVGMLERSVPTVHAQSPPFHSLHLWCHDTYLCTGPLASGFKVPLLQKRCIEN
jgi:hypothetical protein